MTNIIKPTLVLMVVAFFSSFVLSHIDKITSPIIQKQRQEKQDQALAMVLPGYTITGEKTATVKNKPFIYWIAEKEVEGKKKKAYAFKTASPGYSGDIVSMVGIDEEGEILGLSILKQTETPGLGARAEEVATSVTFIGALAGKTAPPGEITRPWFQYQFNGLSLKQPVEIVQRGDWTPAIKEQLIGKNSITAITGATITGRAIITALTEGKALLDEALAQDTEKTTGGTR